MRLAKSMQRIRKKANVIANSEEMNGISKLKQIKKLYRDEKNKMNKKKEYVTVVSRSFKGSSNKVKGMKVKKVDPRMKNDSRALK